MRVGLVVGATGGIGAACATALASQRSVEHMLLTGRRCAPLHNLARQLGAGTCVCDLAESDGRQRLVDELSRGDQQLAWVVIASGMPLPRALSESTEEEIEQVMHANLIGPILLVRKLLELRWVRPARVVVVGSISATRALPDRAVYGASKAGIEHFARSLGAEVAGRGIAVNVVSPGVIETSFIAEAGAGLQEWVHESVPAERTGTPAEVASLVRYLATEAPTYLTGARVAVDGGTEARA